MTTSISVVVPVYNSEQSLRELCARLLPAMSQLADRFELIFVNDGSRDGSWQVICALAEEVGNLRGINMSRNYGQHNALLCGIRAARYEIVVTLDDDLQHPPEEIGKLLAKMAEGYDVVYGTPLTLPHSVLRNLFSRYSKWAMWKAMGIKTAKDVSAFRVLKTDLRRAFENYQSPSLLLDVLLTWGTTKFASVTVEHHPRQVGKSNYNYAKLFNQAMLMLTGFSTAPLRVASWIGFGFTLFGLIVFTYVVMLYSFKGSVPGFPFLASLVSMFSGAQLFALGIMGEYISRMFNRSMDRPTYVIGDLLEANNNTDETCADQLSYYNESASPRGCR